MKGWCENCEEDVDCIVEITNTVKGNTVTIEIEIVCDSCLSFSFDYKEVDVTFDFA